MTRRDFVESLACENRAFYGTQRGRGALRAFELTFEHRWIYVFELVQNALDAGARSIAFRLSDDGDALIFQHDGPNPFNEGDVEGLSNIFRSTKGAASVGFMGIGFKSVFGRFQEARISGGGWRFLYRIHQVIGGEFGDVQTDPLGAVLPIWDDGITEPEEGFTTRFELRMRVDPAMNLESDLTRFLSDEDLTLLAVLAASNLEHLDVNGRVWHLSVDGGIADGSMTATARSEDEERRWQLFPVEFEPSREAIRRFLERRRIQPSETEREQVYAVAARKRRVLGVLPLDDRGVPEPPRRGRIYATLPTEVTLSLRLHVNADWLLNISRTGLGEIEDDPWQRDIADRIADVLANVLDWAARTFRDPDAAEAAFAALAPPSSEAGGLEAILAEERWLLRLRGLLENASVFPVWAEETGALGFARPNRAIVPPPPLAKAFEDQPALRPAALLRGPVLVHRVLGEGGRKLLDRAGLLAEMSPTDLEQAWADGLQSWWETLEDEESTRRDLLLDVWVAVSELTFATGRSPPPGLLLLARGGQYEDPWSTAILPCIRTAGGTWRTVDESVFFNESLPSEGEPGGLETSRLIQPFTPEADCRLAEAWVQTLRQRGGRQRGEQGPLSKAREWIEQRARSIGLRELVESAIAGLDTSPTLDWSPLVPLGRWAMHRGRHDLLIRVLVESANGRKGVPVDAALLAEPYVRGQSRTCLFPNMPVISAAYLEDPETADPREWRTFFEEAGAKGALAVQPMGDRVNQWESGLAAEFLGAEEIGRSNRSGYTLRDFDIEPALPDPNASAEVRAAVAAWLDDGFSKLRGRGYKKVEYFYHYKRDEKGTLPSAWAVKLSELAWVPCGDSLLRRPQDVLPRQDRAREGAPFAVLSEDLLSVLEQEGVKFGTAIPEATALQRFLAMESRLPAEDIAELLREVREQVATDEDRLRFEQALPELVLPSKDNKRVPLLRIVQRVGGRLRGALGGWIVPLDSFHEKLREELEHPAFPYQLPEMTTGKQALAYLREVWARARSSPEQLANEVRNVLPAAYAYCLEDMENDVPLSETWEDTVPKAAVFDGRAWIFPAEADIYLDDIEDRRFFPGRVELLTATGGHLGNSPEQRLRTAEKLGLNCLSAIVEMSWREGDEQAADDWTERFDLICRLLRHVKPSGRAEEEEGGAGTEPMMEWRLRRVGRLDLEVSVEGQPAENVPVNARLPQGEGALTVAGRPIQFGADAAKELLRAFSFGQRANLSADLTAMLTAIDAVDDFNLAADKFRRSFAPDFHLPTTSRHRSGSEEAVGSEEAPAPTSDAGEPTTGRRRDADESSRQEPSSDHSEQATSDPSDNVSTVDIQDGVPYSPRDGESASMGGSFTRDRALAGQKHRMEELKKSLKGEIAPNGDDEDFNEAEEGGPDADGLLGDEVYRRVVAKYEKDCGRNPEYGDPHQRGWDLRSVDPETGAIRLIEVKGRGRTWDGDEVVELSRAQVREAFKMLGEQTAGSWYLYVVERMEDGRYQVLPIENPVHSAGKWILCGGPWRMIAEGPRRIAIDPEP